MKLSFVNLCSVGSDVASAALLYAVWGTALQECCGLFGEVLEASHENGQRYGKEDLVLFQYLYWYQKQTKKPFHHPLPPPPVNVLLAVYKILLL